MGSRKWDRIRKEAIRISMVMGEISQDGSLVADLEIPQYDLSRRAEGFNIDKTKKNALIK